jgi:hypothetical protein
VSRPRHRVRCWFCGKTARRVGPRLRIGIVGRIDTAQTYGLCMGALHTDRDGKITRRCYEPMLTREDAAKVLRAARQYDGDGWNTRSEYDG